MTTIPIKIGIFVGGANDASKALFELEVDQATFGDVEEREQIRTAVTYAIGMDNSLIDRLTTMIQDKLRQQQEVPHGEGN